MACSPQDVFDVLADGWLFPTWVVGSSRMRSVDEHWPAVGAKLHHSFGVWPVLLNDETVMREWDPPRRAVISPKGWPVGEALVTIEAKPTTTGCVVRIQEKAQKGPATVLPHILLDLGLHPRNFETLRRLAFIAEGRA
jgi:hypothetical protein